MSVVDAKHKFSITKGGAFGPIEDPDCTEPLLPPVAERRAANEILNSKVKEHIMVPVTRGQGHSAIEDDAACVVHQHCLEADDHNHLQEQLDSYESFTVDLGTEAKTSDFRISRGDLPKVMPTWMADRQLVLDQEDLDVNERPPRMRYQCPDDGMFLRNAMPIPGINHCIHSVVRGTEEHLSYYDTFIEQCKTLQKVLVNRGRNERLIDTCFLNTPHEGLRQHAEGISIILHEKRWGTTLAFCRATIPAVSVLRRAWNQRAYEGQGEHALKEKDWEEGGIFKPAELSTILRSALFRAYHHMIVKLHHPPHRLASWFEGCPCHEIIMSTPGDDQRICPARREAAMKADGVSYGRCVLSSCRVVESVDGKVDEVIDDINQEISLSFRHTLAMKDQDGLTPPLAEQDKAMVISDFTLALSNIKLGVSVKFGWLKNLPWLLAGLAHLDAEKARRFGRVCISIYDKQEPNERHRISRKFLQEGTVLRDDIASFISGNDMSEVLRIEVAVFHLIPLSDRLIEREHLYLGQVTGYKKGISLGHHYTVKRFLTLSRDLQDPRYEAEFVDAFLKLCCPTKEAA